MFIIIYALTGLKYATSDNVLLLLFGILIQFIFTLAITLRKNIFLFEPIVLMYLAIIVGVTAKIPYLIANDDIMESLLIGQEKSVFIYGTIYIFIGFLFFIIGHLTAFKNRASVSINYKQFFWVENRVRVSLIFMVIITIIASLLVVQTIGIDNLLASFSAKRFQDIDDRTGRLSSELYIYYKISLLSRVPLYISLIYLISNNLKQKKSTRHLIKIIFILSFVISIVLPTIFNNRATVALSIADMVFIGAFMGKKLQKKYLFLAVLLVIIPFIYTTAERTSSELDLNVISSILDHRYFLDLTKTSHIINYFSDQDLRLYGETLIGWLFVVVPSTIMEDKPRFMEIGLYLGDVVFHFRADDLTGVPPGFFAELYMNFGLPGIIIGMFLAGFFMQKMYNYYLKNIRNVFSTVIIAMLSIRFLVFLFNNDLGTFIIKGLLEILPTILILSYVLKMRNNPKILN